MKNHIQRAAAAIAGNKLFLVAGCVILAFFCALFPLDQLDIGAPASTVNQLPVVLAYALVFFVAASVGKRVFLKYTLPLGAFFAVCMVWGWQIEQYETVFWSWQTVCRMVACCLLYTALLVLLWRFLERCQPSQKSVEPVEAARPRKMPAWLPWVLVWLAMMACWLVLQLALWPGFFAYDAGLQLSFYESGTLHTHHPPLHTFLLGFGLSALRAVTGSLETAVAIWLLLQKAFIAVCFTYVVYVLHRQRLPRLLVALSAVYYAAFPVVAAMVNFTTKDVLFSAFVVLFALELVLVWRSPAAFLASKARVARFAAITLVMLLLRNNAVYACLLLLVVLLLAKKGWRKAAVPMAAAMALYFVIQGPVFTAMGAVKGDMREMLCVPLQQLARVYRYAPQTFSDEDLALLHALMEEEDWQSYQPKLADNVKDHANTQAIRQAPGRYIGLWVRTGLKNPGLYLTAFLNNTSGYWYPDAVLNGYSLAQTPPGTHHDYLMPWGDSEVEQTVLLPSVASAYQNLGLYSTYRQIPLFSWLFSIGAMFWLVCVCFVWSLYKKSTAALPMLVFLLALQATVLLGPIALVRYVLYLFFCMPLLVATLVRPVAAAAAPQH